MVPSGNNPQILIGEKPDKKDMNNIHKKFYGYFYFYFLGYP